MKHGTTFNVLQLVVGILFLFSGVKEFDRGMGGISVGLIALGIVFLTIAGVSFTLRGTGN